MAGEEIDPRFFEHARSRDVGLRNELVLENQGLAIAFARRYRDRGVPADDLEQVALEALVGAVDRFEPERGLRFSTFAARTIEGSLKQHFRDRTWDLKVPRSMRQLVVAVRATEDALTQRMGRAPTLHELAGQLGVEIDELTMALEASGSYRAEDLDTSDVSRAADDRALSAADARLVAPQLLELLPAEERRVVELRFYESRSQSAIADAIGVSQMQVSRLLRRALERLRAEVG